MTQYDDIYGIEFSRDWETTVESCPKEYQGEYRIPHGYTRIANRAFDGCTGITSIVIPNSVTKIGDCAFRGCTGLTRIDIPDSVCEIDLSAFTDCSKLLVLNIPDSVLDVRGRFIGCDCLTSVRMPEYGYHWRMFEGCRKDTAKRILRDEYDKVFENDEDGDYIHDEDGSYFLPYIPNCREDHQILLLKHWWNIPDKEEQLEFLQKQISDDVDIHDVEVFDLDDFSREHWVERDVNPYLLGPCYSSDGLRAENLENLWQFGKVYGGQVIFNKSKDEQIPVVMTDAQGEPTEAFFRIRKMGFEQKRAYRHPYNTHDCLYHYYVKDGKNMRLDYITSRKKVYIPEYAKLVVQTRGFKHLQDLVRAGKTIALVDYDAYNYYNPMYMLQAYHRYKNAHPEFDAEPAAFLNVVTARDAVNFPYLNCGHGFVLKMLLQGNISVEGGEVVDNCGILITPDEEKAYRKHIGDLYEEMCNEWNESLDLEQKQYDDDHYYMQHWGGFDPSSQSSEDESFDAFREDLAESEQR